MSRNSSLETVIHPLGHGAAVAARGGLVAEPMEIALGRISLGHGGLRQGVAQVRAEVEMYTCSAT